MKRQFSLVSSILAMVFNSIYIIGLIFLFLQVDSEIASHKRGVVYAIISLLLICLLVSIVFNALSIKFCNKINDNFKVKDALMNFTMAIGFIISAISIIVAFIGFDSWLILFVLEAIASISTATLLLVAMILENLRKKDGDSEERNLTKAQTINHSGNSFSNRGNVNAHQSLKTENRTINISANPLNQNSSVDKLIRLQQLLERGLITREEYEKLKMAITGKKTQTQQQAPKQKSKLQMQLEVLDGMLADGIIGQEDYNKLKISLIKENIK